MMADMIYLAAERGITDRFHFRDLWRIQVYSIENE